MTNTQITVTSNESNPLLKGNLLTEVEEDIFNTVNAAVARCYADTNTVVPEKSKNDYLINQLTDNILNNFPSIRLVEIPIAFANGIRGIYGQYFGLSVVSFEQFLTGYLNSDHRARLVEERNRLMIEERKEPTIDEKFDMGKQLCVDAINQVKLSRPVGLPALTVFEFLNRLELIHKDYKIGIMKQALELTVRVKEHEIVLCMDLLKRRKLNTELALLKENIEKDMITKQQYEVVLRTAKEIALNNFLNDLVLNEEELSGLIEAKRGRYKELAAADQRGK
ncbi:hypothetical protein GCM10023149_48750 [Mucilaginibacter gynuensis]|uniref:Uncharacterized protein n=1 Tax=Mucilaginibacter gynuensis TaxID=1302236 RepID=A0ABP8HFT8_9SPHI